MGVSSFFFISGIEHRHLIHDVESAFVLAETGIISDFMEHETFLAGYSETVRGMILDGEDENSISAYMKDIAKFIHNNEHLEDMSGTHGYFFSWGGKYISNIDLTPPADSNPEDQPCYTAAFGAEGKIIISELYTDAMTGNVTISFSRYITDDNGNPLGVVCVDMNLERISEYVNTINLTKGSYGILLNNRLEIISHPAYYFKGHKLRDINSGMAGLAAELETGVNIYERKVKNYLNLNTIVYFKKIKYDWYLGIVIPVNEYHQNINNMAVFLIVVGSILAAIICTMIYNISRAKIDSDTKTQQKSNFLATMSHEIRTPLNTILGMTEIELQNETHPPSTSEAFIKINNSGNLLLNIINDILDLSKIEAGKMELVPVKYEVASLINDIVQLNFVRYETKPVEFILEIDENIPSILVGDELRIKQILNNLLSNAFKYTDRGKITLSINAECIGRAGAVLVTLIFQVSDTGQGMTPKQVEKLFDEYTRFNLEANRATEGAGLGMTITRNLVNLMYGKIFVKSAVGEGTTVTVRLPQKTHGRGVSGVISREMIESLRQFRHSNAIQLKKSKIIHEYMPYGRVLIVDDVESNLYVAKGLMIPYGLNIDLASSGFEAIEKIKQGNTYDIVFMDHMMPNMDGIETTRLLREMGYTRPVVALTANAVAGQEEIFLESGFDGFISKPIDIRHLNVTMNRLVRDKQSSEVIEAANKAKAEMKGRQETGRGQQQVDPQLAEIFARDAKKAAAVLETCMQNNLQNEDDIHMYIINVHAMKSALANIGEAELSAEALRLEQAGRGKDINVMFSETNAFIEKLYNVIKGIKLKEEDDEISEDTEDSLALLNEKLTVIKGACAAFDKKAAKNALGELREKTWSHSTKELLNKIAEHLLHSDFDNAAAIADEYMNKL
jgi:signal transduction histidine kinase/DNA-binding response OmpR family regulator